MSGRGALQPGTVLLRGAWLAAFLVCYPVFAAEALRNGGFETGDLTGWTASGPSGFRVFIINKSESLSKEGDWFAVLKSQPEATAPTTLTQSFHAKAGSIISGWASFESSGDPKFFKDNPVYDVVIRGGGGEQSVFSGNDGYSKPWTEWKYSFPAEDDYTLVATVNSNGLRLPHGSFLKLDGVSIATPADTKAPVVTPPKDIRVEIAAREKTAPASHPDIAAFLNAATANDDRDGTLTAKAVNPPAGFPVGETTVTFEAVDAAGNKGTATARVSVFQAPVAVTEPPVGAEAPKPTDTPLPTLPPLVEPVPPATPTVTEVKNPDGSVTWTFRGEIVEHEVDYHTFTANKDWLYIFEIGDGKNPAQWIRVDPGGRHAPRESTSYAVQTHRRFAWVPPETKDYRVQVWAAKGPYLLTVTGRADDHGNDWQHATPVELGQTVPGELWEILGSDVDVFSFQGKKGGIYRIETQQPENPRGVLRVYDRQRGGATREAKSGEKPSRNVTFNTPRDDTYYIQVWGGVGKYTLKVTRLK